MRQFQVLGRKAPTDAEPNPKVFRMKLFARDAVHARSRYWYFMHQYAKMKKTTGEIVAVNEIMEKNANILKVYGIWLRYNSRTGTHNMYKEYRDLTLNAAVDQMYDEMSGRHRCRPASIQIVKTGIVKAKDVKRTNTLQFIDSKIKFPLPHRIPRASSKGLRKTFATERPCTVF